MGIAFSVSPRMKFHYISTVNTLGSKLNRQGDLLPSEKLPALESMVDYPSGYAQSKWAGEKLVEKARAEGLQTTVHRCGMICWSSKTGAGNYLNRDMRLLGTVLATRTAPHSEASWRLLPADCAARIVVTLSSESAGGEVFHINNPNKPTRHSELFCPERWALTGVDLDTVSHQEWFSKVKLLDSSQRRFRVIDSTIREGYRFQLPGESGARVVDPRLLRFASSISDPSESVHLAVGFLCGDASRKHEL